MENVRVSLYVQVFQKYWGALGMSATWQGRGLPAALMIRPLARSPAPPASKLREVGVCFNVSPRLSEFCSCSQFDVRCFPFLSLITVDIWGRMVLCDGGRPPRRRAFHSVPGLNPLDANSNPHPHVVTISL